jgi:multidrug resistance efflux pump
MVRFSFRLTTRFALAILTPALLVSACASGNGDPLKASGTVEATQIILSPEVGGRVIQVQVNEGDQVKAGQPLLRLDDTLLRAQLQQAESALKAAQANDDLLAAGPTAEQLRQAQSALDAAKADYDLLKSGPTDEQLRQAEAALVVATAGYSRTISGARPSNVAAAQSALTAATDAYDKVKAGPLPEDYAAAEAAYDNAQAALQQAQFAYDAAYKRDPAGIGASSQALALQQATNNYNAARAAYDKAAQQPDAAQISAAYQQVQNARAALDAAVSPARDFDVVQARAQVDQAQAQLDATKAGARPQQLDAAKAQVDAAQAALDALKAGARAQQLDAARAQVDAAQAAVDALKVQINKLVLVAPADGVLLARAVEQGEVAQAGAEVLTMARLDDLTLTVYVPEDRYGAIKLNQPAQVTVDSFPNVHFSAKVDRIADQAEFTPRNVQTAEGRSSTVFAVRLAVTDPSGRLKPGMPADVTFQ